MNWKTNTGSDVVVAVPQTLKKNTAASIASVEEKPSQAAATEEIVLVEEPNQLNNIYENLTTPEHDKAFAVATPSNRAEENIEEEELYENLRLGPPLPSKDVEESEEKVPRPPTRGSTRLISKKKEKVKEEKEEEKISPEEVKRFFQHLSDQPPPSSSSLDNPQEEVDPIREMFRRFGGELCRQNPDQAARYLRAYQHAST